MHKTLTDLLAIDATARQHGCGLNPRLRAAIEADMRFPSVAASPRPQAPLTGDDLPEGVTLLSTASAAARKSA